MRKTYSFILLVSFLVGTLQPVLPMIEYQLFHGNVLELLADETCEGEEPVKTLVTVQDEDCHSKNSPDQGLLDTDFYPLAVQNISVPDPSVYLNKSAFHPPLTQKVTGPSYLPNSPPPQVS